jgi:hypothetical protein
MQSVYEATAERRHWAAKVPRWCMANVDNIASRPRHSAFLLPLNAYVVVGPAQPGIAVGRFAREVGAFWAAAPGALAAPECQAVGLLHARIGVIYLQWPQLAVSDGNVCQRRLLL